MKNSLLMGVLIFSTSSVVFANPEFRYSRDNAVHYANSKARVLSRFGVYFNSYQKFFDGLILNKKTKPGSGAVCVPSLSDSTRARSALLNCLAAYGRHGLDVTLFSRLSTAKWSRIQKSPTNTEIQRTIALLAYLEDVTREELESRGINTAWWVNGKGFWTQGKNQAEFEYQDGDILLLIGNSSISSVISQSTAPQRRFSHALMVRMEKGEFSTLEAIIEKGVTSIDRKKFSKQELQTVVVLRWKNKKQREQVAARASDCGKKLLDNKTPYNFSMDLADTSKMFCSQLVAHCYSISSGFSVQSMIPQVGAIRSDEVFEYLKNMGVQSRTMPSPGDLATSKHFEVVAEFRKTRDDQGSLALARLWDMFTLGDVFVERLEIGQTFRFDAITAKVVRPLLDVSNFTLATVGGNIFGRDISVLGGIYPEGIDTRTAGFMAVQERLIFKQVWKQAEKNLNATPHPQVRGKNLDSSSLIYTHPIYRRTAMSLEMNQRGPVSTQIFN
jgi:hypothetical protein